MKWKLIILRTCLFASLIFLGMYWGDHWSISFGPYRFWVAFTSLVVFLIGTGALISVRKDKRDDAEEL